MEVQKNYKSMSETKRQIKEYLKEMTHLESQRNILQDDVIDRILYLMELYIRQEVELLVKEKLDCLISNAIKDYCDDDNQEK